jgi:signal transduction histidine kinase
VSNIDARAMEELRREAAELRASRARVVSAADDQRRSIERELHDGTMQHLVALGVNLQLADGLAPADSPELTELLGEMLRNVHEALDEVRQLAWRVYPSLLLDRGLGEALRTATSGAAALARVETAAVDRYPPEIEASIYFCCVELLQLAAHDGHHAIVRVRSERDLVLFDVILEDADLDEWGTRDLSRLTDRVGAFGGRLTIGPAREPERGVRISGAIPTRPDAQAMVARPSSVSAR